VVRAKVSFEAHIVFLNLGWELLIVGVCECLLLRIGSLLLIVLQVLD